ncbi:MAG: hypothetical protein J5J06_11345 [Phycisphaerae bacterium]|nr:hypothetical protein [Phycisphaerae bacterium]
MSAQDWPVVRPTGVCAASGRVLAEGEEFYSVLIEEGDTFRREDYSLEAWPGAPAGTFCYFRSRVPARKDKRRQQNAVGDESLVDFFLRLEGEDEPTRVQFRFVLALMLMRKRKLRYEGSAMEDDLEVWEMTLGRDQSRHRVINPRLADNQIDAVGRELTALLQGESPDPAWEGDGASPVDSAGVEHSAESTEPADAADRETRS